MMKAYDLYNRMETDFNLSACDDDWSEINIGAYLAPQYRERYMGLVTDNSEHIDYVYTAVFPSAEVIDKIINDNRKNALLFLHHPMDWDINKTPIFTDIPLNILQTFKERNISIYNLHTPLDAFGTYSTSVCFATALGIEIMDNFYEYHKVNVGVICKIDCETVSDVEKRFQAAVGHNVTLYQYGDSNIQSGKVALVAGGGNDAEIYPLLRDMGITTYLTGIASLREYYQPSVEAHNSAKACGINILSGTHYSTEKFACMKMVEYFAKLGLQGEFIGSKPCMEDM